MKHKNILSSLLLALSVTGICNAAERLPFSSSFEGGNFSEWSGGPDSSLIVTNEDASSGSFSARAQMVNGQATDNYKDYYFGDHLVVGGEPADDELWLEFDSKFDTNFMFGQNEDIHKIAILNFEDENGRRRYQLVINILLPGETYFIENLSWNADRSFNKTVDAYSQNTGSPTQLNRGQWENIRMFVKLNTPGQHNGVIRFWLNDSLIIEVTDAYMREATNYNPNKLILSNYVTDTDVIGYQRWDNFYLGEQAPAEIVRPMPPILHD
ncbi:MAG: polysaccharide lyase [Gammaproteobacteria bacterium]|nr:polysaccharide lyase [Gammaproteobacteria bacterium]